MAVIDFAFRVSGDSVPVDHGYALYSCLCRKFPWLHGPSPKGGLANPSLWSEVGIHPITGKLQGDRLLKFTPASRLTIRVGSEHIGEFLSLIGESLDVDGSIIRIGTPEVIPLRPAPRLYSRLVVIKGFMEPQGFLAAVIRQAEANGIRGTLGLPYRSGTASVEGTQSKGSIDPLRRRTLDIRGKHVVGYAVLASELTADESIILQEKGLGGRRRFGCGIFVPATE